MTLYIEDHAAGSIDALIGELDALRTALVAAGEPRSAIRRLDDTIAFLRHRRVVPAADAHRTGQGP